MSYCISNTSPSLITRYLKLSLASVYLHRNGVFCTNNIVRSICNRMCNR